jgi:beta-glucosidase
LTGHEPRVAIIGEDPGANDWGPNGCRDKGCNRGTLASQWGSGSWLLPYLITPEQAITDYIVANTSSAVASITNNHADCQIEVLASQANVAILFVNANSGEGYLTVDGNWGDRNNLTLWGGGNELIEKVASICNNPIVIMHTTGPVLTSSFHENPNVTAILWSAPAGEQSGPPVVDVLYGLYNYSGKPPFAMAERRSDYGAEVLYEPNNGDGAPQQDVSGLDSDYRHFDMLNITPIYEFGFGLSYTTFDYSNLTITPLEAVPYQPASGSTIPAPTIAADPIDISNVNTSGYLFPSNIPQYPTFIYP